MVSVHACGINEKIMNQFYSLSQRLEFICRGTDKVSYFSLKYANNHTQNNALYHLGYLIMLITGAFDDLAWILDTITKQDITGFLRKYITKTFRGIATTIRLIYSLRVYC